MEEQPKEEVETSVSELNRPEAAELSESSSVRDLLKPGQMAMLGVFEFFGIVIFQQAIKSQRRDNYRISFLL